MKSKSVRWSVALLIVTILVLFTLMGCQLLQPSPPEQPLPALPQPVLPQPGQLLQPDQPLQPGQPGQPQPGQPGQPGQPQPGQPEQPGQPQPGQPMPSGCAGAPVIPFFNANPTSITADQSSTLSWGDVTNGTTGPWVQSTVINPGLGEVGSGASSRSVTPATTTTYTLVATGCGGTVTRQVTIIVNPSSNGPAPSSGGQAPSSGGQSGCAGAPVIPFFNANPASITSGQSSALSWGNVTNGNTGPQVRSVKIEPGLGEVGSGASSRTVNPTQTTTYTLTATGCGGTATKNVTVNVTSGGIQGIAPIPGQVMAIDLAVDNIYPAPTGHIMATLKNAGNVNISGSYKLTCSGSYTDSGGNHALPLTGQYAAVNLAAGQKADFDTTYSRNPSITEMWVSCTIIPPAGDSNGSNNTMGMTKVK